MRSRPLAFALVASSLAASRPGAALEPTRTAIAECLSASERGQLERDDGHYTKARASFTACAASVCPPVVQRDCTSALQDIDAKTPTIVFAVRDASGTDRADVELRMDGTVLATRLDGKPLAVDPGEHVFGFDAGDHRIERRIVVAAGEKNRVLRVAFDEAAPSSGPPAATIVSGGVAAVALGAAIVLWATAKSDLRAIESSPCASTKTCADDDLSSVRTRLVAGDVAAAVSLVAIGVGAYFWLTRDRAAAVRVGPTGRDLVRIGGSF